MDVAVVMGGWSRERQVSLWSGEEVAGALERLGHRVRRFDLTRTSARDLADLRTCDVAFNALHGAGGEDGVVVGALETFAIPYTHSGIMASAVAMDKHATRRLALLLDIRTAEGRLVKIDELRSHPFSTAYVVKPRFEGSTLGVTIVNPGDPPYHGDWPYQGDPLVERFIDGVELSVGLVDGAALEIVEIVPEGSLFDFESKYSSSATRHVIPARLPEAIREQALEWSERLWGELGCRDIARADFRYDGKLGGEGLYFLEINTHPGLTKTSLLPELAASRGLPFDALIGSMVNRHRRA